ncbi:hypothetical protein AB0C61_04440 [Streptomyces sp. NPDC048680]|uniref:hypothetical protein n=1 Tax=Streptomyces sp. NPDC048680 TaxID=3155492 RepID=UPI0034124EF3
MDVQDLRRLIHEHVSSGTLTITVADLGTGAAAGLVTDWFGGTLTLRDVTLRDSDTGVDLDGTLDWLAVKGRKVTGAAFAIDPQDRTPSLFLPCPLPEEWKFSTSFPPTLDSPLDGLRYAAGPELLLTSVRRQAGGGRPALEPGLTFHASQVKAPDKLGDLARLLPVTSGLLGLSGPIRRTDPAAPDIRLSCAERDSGTTLHASFALFAGSRQDGTGKMTYDVRVGARLVLSPQATVLVTAPVGASPVVLGADVLPTGRVPVGDLDGWSGSGVAVRQLTQSGLGLGDSVVLSGLTATLDPTRLHEGLAAALTEVTVGATTQPGFSWPIAGDEDFKLTGVGVQLAVATPLQPSPSATVTGFGDFLIADSVILKAKAAIPPGTFELTLAKGSSATLKNLVRHFLPTADLSGAPEITLDAFYGETTPIEGYFDVTGQVDTEIPLSLGAATLTLTGIGAEVWRRPTGPGTHTLGACLSAEAALAPAGSQDAVTFQAQWWIPGTFALTGAFPTISLTDLLKRLAADTGLSLPVDLPVITLKETTATVRRGAGYELALKSSVDFEGTKQLHLLGKATKDTGAGTSTVFVAAIWQEAWSWSPRDVPKWKDALGILAEIDFAHSGLAVSSADNQPVTGGDALPAAFPPKVDKGLTFFTEIAFAEKGGLHFLHKLFPDAHSIALTALLASDIKKSEFTATIGETETKKNFGGLILKIVPADFSIALSTSFVLDLGDLSFLDAPGNGKLSFTGSGSVAERGGVWNFSLRLVLEGAYGLPAGQLLPHQFAYALDAPGYTLLTAEPAPGVPSSWDPFPTAPPADTSGGTSPAWKNAFGVEGFDVNDFFLEVLCADGEFSMGGGGDIQVGGTTLALAAYGGFEPPAITAFYFALKTGTPAVGQGVSLYDIVHIVVTPPAALDFLKRVVLKQLTLCVVTTPGEWEHPVTHQKWSQGFYAKGDIGILDNTWKFEVEISPTGLYARSDIADPIKIGDVVTLSDATGGKGPQYLLDLKGIKKGTIPATVMSLSGRVKILGVEAALAATLGASGFTFDFTTDLKIFKADLKCTLGDDGLHAEADAELSFTIPAPKGLSFADLLSVDVSGGVTLDITEDKAMATVDFRGKVTVAGQSLGDITLAPAAFGISSFDRLTSYFTDDPDLIWKQLDDTLWETVKDCAMKKAGASL